MSRVVQVAPSLLAADFTGIGDAIRSVESAGADLLHLDIMDGRFVPNISFGPVVVAAARRVTRLPLDVHLMIEEPIRYLGAFADAGADGITVHVEACTDVVETLGEIRDRRLVPGLTLRPRTPFADVEPFLELVDLILVMTVEPGFGGQRYMPDQEAKLRRARELRASAGHDYRIEVDGGITRETARSAVAAGADILVAGTAIFQDDDPAGLIREWHQLQGIRASSR